MAGYSRRSLVDKLGIRDGATIAILNPPHGYTGTLGPLPARVARKPRATGSLDFIQFFSRDKRQLVRHFPSLARALAPAGMLWISLPKRSSGVPTDLTEDVIRAIGLAHRLVDVKVAGVCDVSAGPQVVRRATS